MHKKLNFTPLTANAFYWFLPLTFVVWLIMYLYFLSSAQVPVRLNDYEKELHIREHALRRTLTKRAIINPDSTELAQIYESLSKNEICLGDLPAAKKHLQAFLHCQNKLLVNKEQFSTACLENANLSRDMNEFNLAKVNYERSLDYFCQIAFTTGLNEAQFNTIAVNFNNLGVLYFLMGQKKVTTEQRLKCYVTARNYFVQAKKLMLVVGNNKSHQCFRRNIDDNLNQSLIEMQFSKQL